MESAFLNLLTDGGIISLGVYLSAILVILMRVPTTLGIIFNVGVLLVSMQISRVGLGFLDGTLFGCSFGICYLNQEWQPFQISG